LEINLTTLKLQYLQTSDSYQPGYQDSPIAVSSIVTGILLNDVSQSTCALKNKPITDFLLHGL